MTVTFPQPSFLGGYELGLGSTRGPTTVSGTTPYAAGVGNGFFGDPSRTRYAVRFQWDAHCESSVPQQVGNGVSCQARAGLGTGEPADDEMRFGVAIIDDDPPSPTPSPPRTATSTHTPLPTGTVTSTQTPTFTPTATGALPALAIGDASVVEGNTGTRSMLFRIDVRGSHPVPITAQFATADGTASAGSDYTAATGTVLLPVTTNSATIAIPVLGDARREHDETFTVTLTGALGATIVRPLGTGTIVDDDLVGVPELQVPELSTVPGEVVPLTLRWTHPERWRALDTVDLRLVDDAGVVFWGRFTEGPDHFSVCDGDTCSGDFAPGAGEPVDAGEARFHPDESAVHGTGPSGPSVDLTFAVSLARSTAGRELRVEVAATDDDGDEQPFAEVGSVAVAGGGSGADDDACQVGPAGGRGGLWLLLAAAALRLAAGVSRRRSGGR